jgi:hypothetical protein
VSLRDDLLPLFDETRALLAEMEVGPNRLTDVTLRVTTWTGAPSGVAPRPGLGTKTVVETPMTLDAQGHRVKVQKLSSREVLASGGKYQDGDYKIGPFTPTYDSGSGGRQPDYFSPAADGTPREVHVILDGPGLAHVVCKIIDTNTDKTFAWGLTVRRVNQV